MEILEIVSLVVALLVAVEALINYLLPEETAKKFAFIGQILSFLRSTKAGLSPKIDKK